MDTKTTLLKFSPLQSLMTFFKYKWFGNQLQCVSHFFVQDENSKSLLLDLGLPVANDDFQNYLVEISVIGIDKFVTIVFLAIFLISFFYKKV